MARTVVAVFDSKYVADQAVFDLRENGMSGEMIEMFARPILKAGAQVDDQKSRRVPAEISISDLGAGIQIGAGIGGGLGIAGGLLIISGALTIPGLAPLLTGGLLAWSAILLGAILVGALAGGFAGSLLGGLFGLAISEQELQQYARIVRENQVVVTVLADWGLIDPVLKILENHNPLEIEEKAYSPQKSGDLGGTASSPQVQSMPKEREEHQ